MEDTIWKYMEPDEKAPLDMELLENRFKQLARLDPFAAIPQMYDLIRLHRDDICQASFFCGDSIGKIEDANGIITNIMLSQHHPSDAELLRRLVDFLSTPAASFEEFLAMTVGRVEYEGRIFLLEVGAKLFKQYGATGRREDAARLEALIGQRLRQAPTDAKISNLAAFCSFLREDFEAAMRLSSLSMESEDPFLSAVGFSNAAIAAAKGGKPDLSRHLIAQALSIAMAGDLAPGVLCFHLERALSISATEIAVPEKISSAIEARIAAPIDYYDHRMLCSHAFGPHAAIICARVRLKAESSVVRFCLGSDIVALYQAYLERSHR